MGTPKRRGVQRQVNEYTQLVLGMVGLNRPLGFPGLGGPVPGEPFETTADRQCAGCGGVLPADRFDGPVVPGDRRANRCRECVAAGVEPMPREDTMLLGALQALEGRV